MAKHGKEKRTKLIQIKTTPSLKARAQERAKNEGLSLSNYIEQLLLKDIENPDHIR